MRTLGLSIIILSLTSVNLFGQVKESQSITFVDTVVTGSANELNEREVFGSSLNKATAASTAFDVFYDFESGLPTTYGFFGSGKFYYFSQIINALDSADVANVQPTIEADANTFNETNSVKSANIPSNGSNRAAIWFLTFPESVGAAGGQLDFKFRISSESTFDYFHLCIENSGVYTCPTTYQRSGDVAWGDFVSIPLVEGDERVYFAYTKDTSVDTGLDAFYVDNVSIQDFTSGVTSALSISDVQPRSGIPGTQVEIFGSGYDADGSGLAISVNGVSVITNSYDATSAIFQIPETALGLVDIQVQNSLGTFTLENSFSILDPDLNGLFDGSSNVISSSLSPRHLNTTDFNNDGIADILVSYQSNDEIAWFAGNGDGTFGTKNIVSNAVQTPLDHAVADYDGDGDYDIASVSFVDGDIWWWANNGAGTFGATNVVSSSLAGPTDVLAMDVDSDGDVDLVAPSLTGGTIVWYPNDGSGNFGTATTIINVSAPSVLEKGDMNNDGLLDLIVAPIGNTNLRWFINNGDASFSSEIIVPGSINDLTDFKISDVDGDGLADIVASNAGTDEVAAFINDGSNSFTKQAISVGAASTPVDISLSDIDSDGDIDVVVPYSGDSELIWYRNNGSASFSEVTVATNAFGASDVISLDFDQDGDLDLVSSYEGAEIIAILENLDLIAPKNATATETNLGITVSWQVPDEITVGGYNVYRSSTPIENINDATRLTPVPITDLFLSDQTVVPTQEYYYVVTAVESGTGTETLPSNNAFSRFQFKSIIGLESRNGLPNSSLRIYGSNLTNVSSTSVTFVGNPQSVGATVTAINANYIDVTVPSVEPGNYRIQVINDGTQISYSELFNVSEAERGFFPSYRELNSNSGEASAAAMGDIDGDDDLDIVVYFEGDSKAIGWFENDGTGFYGDFIFITDDFQGADAVSSNIRDIKVADLDLDGNLDIIFNDFTDNKIYSLLNQGNAQFSDPVAIMNGTIANPPTFELLDIDNDADVDIVFLSNNNTLYFQKNSGLGDFDDPVLIDGTGGASVLNIITADVNGDGLLDLLTSKTTSGVFYYLNNGNGFDAAVSAFTVDGSTRYVAAGDIDNDGDIDIATAGSSTSQSSNGFAFIYKNDGAGAFTLDQTSPFIPAPTNTLFEDLSGDGLKDFIIDSNSDSLIYRIINQGSAAVTDISNLDVIMFQTFGSEDLELGDIDNDGDLDMISVSLASGVADITIHENIDPPPASPTNVTATTRIGRIEIDWDDNVEADLSGYRVLRSVDNSPVWTFISNGEITTSFFTDENIETGRLYSYFVGAFDETGNANYTFFGPVDGLEPRISGLMPDEGAPTEQIRITGFGFASASVDIDGQPATVLEQDSSFVVFQVPELVAGPQNLVITSEGYSDTTAIPFFQIGQTDALFSGGTDFTSDNFTGNLTFMDIDNNGFMDLLETFPDASRVDYRINDGSGIFGALNTLSSSVSTVQKIVPIDINNDAHLDLVSIPRASDIFHVYINNGTVEDVANTYTVTEFIGSNSLPTDLIVADMNRDGRQDIIISSTLDSKINYYPNLSHSDTLLFGPQQLISTNAGGPIAIRAMDVNQDGYMDIISAEVGNNNINVYTQQTDGTFNKTTASVVSGVVDIEVIDENGDGPMDIISAYNSGGTGFIQINRNAGNGFFFDEAQLFTYPEEIRKIDVADLNGDAQMDLVVAGPTIVTTYINQGLGSFAQTSAFQNTNKSINDIIIFEADNDGDMDFAYRSATDGQTTVHRNIVQTPLTISSFTAPNNGILVYQNTNGTLVNNSLLTLVLAQDLSNLTGSGLSAVFANAIQLNVDGASTTSGAVGQGYSPEISTIYYRPNVYPEDVFNITLLSEQMFINSSGEFFIDGNQNGIYDGAADNFDSQIFEMALIADYDLTGSVWTSDLSLFVDAWNNNTAGFELAPLVEETFETFPKVRTIRDSVYDVEDLITFIRFWNYSISRGKIQLYDQNSKVNLKANSSEPLAIKKKSVQNDYGSNGGQTKITYGIDLASATDLKALGLQLSFNPNEIELHSITNSKLFDTSEESNTIFLSHIDTTRGLAFIQLANLGTSQPVVGREIAELEIISKNGSNANLEVTTELIPMNGEMDLFSQMASLEVADELPQEFALEQNYPNPFNPSTSIQYQLASNAEVSLKVYDLLGREVQQLANGQQRAGYYSVEFDASRLASGMYIYVLQAKTDSGESLVSTKKMMLIK